MLGAILKIVSQMSAYCERQRPMETLLELKGQFYLEQWRDGKLLRKLTFPNGATNVGKQYLLGASFAGTTPITSWYLGAIDGTDGTPTIATEDTALSHAWDEFTTYDESIRQSWTKAINTATNQMVSSAAAQFTISAGVAANSYIAGAFLISNSTKNGTTGTLYAHGLFPAPVPVQAGDIFRLNYLTGL